MSRDDEEMADRMMDRLDHHYEIINKGLGRIDDTLGRGLESIRQDLRTALRWHSMLVLGLALILGVVVAAINGADVSFEGAGFKAGTGTIHSAVATEAP